MTLQLDENGLQTETQTEISERLGERAKQQFGVNTKTNADSIMGQLINIEAESEAVAQQTLMASYRSYDPNGAIGAALDRALTMTGSVRLGATNSVVDGLLEFSGAGAMANGDLIRNDDNDTLWQLTDGPIVAGAPGFFAAQFTAVETGEILADAGTTWSLVTVIPNLVGFTNPADDAEPGRDQEPDADARQRRQLELFSQGQGPLVAIQGIISKVDGVTFVRVYHNPTVNPADSDGIPFKAFNVVVETNPLVPPAALQQLIFDAIWSALGAGGEAYGTDFSGDVVDSEGTDQPVAFDTVDQIDIELEIDLVTSTSENPITPNIESVVKTEILARAQANHEAVGRDVLALDYQGIVQGMQTDGTISGVDAVVVRMSIQPAPVALVDKLDVSIREKPDFDSANVTVAQT